MNNITERGHRYYRVIHGVTKNILLNCWRKLGSDFGPSDLIDLKLIFELMIEIVLNVRIMVATTPTRVIDLIISRHFSLN